MKLSKLPNRQRNFEALEPRNLLAGNVTADASTGTLVIQGDNSANVITLTQPAPGQIKVAGSGTKVNGSNSAQTFTVTNGIYIDMSGGSDVLTIKNLTVPGVDPSHEGGLAITMGTGNDVVVMTNVNVFDGFAAIDTGDGSDAVTISKSSFTGSGLYIAVGSGTNAVAISNSFMQSQLQILGGSGVDAITLVNDTIINVIEPPSIVAPADLSPSDAIDNIFTVLENDFSGTTEAPGAFIDTGSGVDAVVITGAQFGGITEINTEGGNDAVAISNSRFGDAQFVAVAVEPAVTPVGLDESGLCIETGLGNDAVSIVTTTVYGFLQVDTSGEVDCPVCDRLSNQVQPDQPQPGVKDGNDAVALVKVNVYASAEMEECCQNWISNGASSNVVPDELSGCCCQCIEDECGKLLIYTGNQIDAVSLVSVFTDCEAKICTTDQEDSSLDGTDSVAIVSSKFNQNSEVVEWCCCICRDTWSGLSIHTGNGNDVVAITKVNVNGKAKIDTGNGTDVVALAFLAADEICASLGPGSHDVLTVSNCTANDEIFDDDGGSGGVLNYKHLNNHFGSAPLISVNGWGTIV